MISLLIAYFESRQRESYMKLIEKYIEAGAGLDTVKFVETYMETMAGKPSICSFGTNSASANVLFQMQRGYPETDRTVCLHRLLPVLCALHANQFLILKIIDAHCALDL